MGRYLDALKKVEIVGDDYPNKPKELEKGGILGLLGTPPPSFEINNVANDGDQDTDNNRHYRWLIHSPDRDPVETCCLPEPTHAEVLAMYPDAIAAEPMPERIRHQPTPEQDAELKARVAAVGVAYAFTHEEQQEALALALSDPDAALMSYRAMAAELGNELDQDDRRRRDQCANLRRAMFAPLPNRKPVRWLWRTVVIDRYANHPGAVRDMHLGRMIQTSERAGKDGRD